MAAPPLGWVRITSTDPPLSVTARLGEDPPTMTDGYGGWDIVERPRRAPLTTWKAPPARQLSLSLLLDGWASHDSVERACGQLANMGRPTASDGEPPQLHVSAPGGSMPGKNLTWVASNIEWGSKLVNAAGNRVRQQVTLTLVEYVEDVYLSNKSAANKRRAANKAATKKRGAKVKRYVVKAGETLSSIAARQLGDAKRWTEIAKLNKLRDPKRIKKGQVLRLP